MPQRAKFDGWHAQFEFKPRDLWIGAYWKRIGNCVDVWICFLPCLPLHLSWWWTREYAQIENEEDGDE